MSSDRGTIARGTGSEPGAWSAPTPPGGRRLPSAPRERKPALAALAVVLIVGGGLVAALLVIKAGNKVGAIEITRPVGQGQQIPSSAMREVQVTSGSGLNYVPWNQASQVARAYAAFQIAPNTLLTPQMTTSGSNLAAGKEVLGLALKDGQLPSGLQVGNHVDVYEVSASGQSCPGRPGSTLTTDAVVLSIGRPANSTGTTVSDVQLAVSPPDAGAVACSAANGVVGVAIRPGSGQAAAVGGAG